jgi:hypothetical protein
MIRNGNGPRARPGDRIASTRPAQAGATPFSVTVDPGREAT